MPTASLWGRPRRLRRDTAPPPTASLSRQQDGPKAQVMEATSQPPKRHVATPYLLRHSNG
eukprot:6058119-Prymnesium_polylepis.1